MYYTVWEVWENETVPSVWVEKGRGIILQYPACSVLNCAILVYGCGESIHQ